MLPPCMCRRLTVHLLCDRSLMHDDTRETWANYIAHLLPVQPQSRRATAWRRAPKFFSFLRGACANATRACRVRTLVFAPRLQSQRRTDRRGGCDRKKFGGSWINGTRNDRLSPVAGTLRRIVEIGVFPSTVLSTLIAYPTSRHRACRLFTRSPILRGAGCSLTLDAFQLPFELSGATRFRKFRMCIGEI